MQKKKTVMEWNEDVKLLNKKISKIVEDFKYNNKFIVDTKENVKNRKTEYNEAAKKYKAEYERLIALQKNRDKIRCKILEFNATKEIKVNGITYTVAIAIEKYRNQTSNCPLLYDQVNKKIKAREAIEKKKNIAVKDKETQLFGKEKNISEKEKELVNETKEKYSEEIIDLINLEKIYEEEIQAHDEFLNRINIELNKINVENELEIDMDTDAVA